MKTGSGDLVTHLTTGKQFKRTELWTFTLADGTVLRLTTLDVNVTVGADTWLTNGPVLSRPGSRMVAGGEVSEFEITVEPGASDTIGGLPWALAARRGVLRHGRVLIERAYMPTWGDVSLGKLFVMGGRMAEIGGSASEIRITVRSDLELLNVNVPVELVQPSCRHTLFDSGCTLSAAAHDVSATILTGSTVGTLLATLSEATDWFSLGRVVFNDGPNAGSSRQIKKHTSGSPDSLALALPLYHAPVNGNSITLYPGCDRLQATCGTKFSNVVNFGGQPFVPQPETAL